MNGIGRATIARVEAVAGTPVICGRFGVIAVLAASSVLAVASGASMIRDLGLVQEAFSPSVVEDMSGSTRAEGLSPLDVEDLAISMQEPRVGERVSLSGWIANYGNQPVRVNVTPLLRDTTPPAPEEPSPSRIASDSLIVRTSNLANTIVSPGERRAFRLIFEMASPMEQPIAMGVALTWIESEGMGGPRTSSATPYFKSQPATAWHLALMTLSAVPIGIRLLVALSCGVVVVALIRRRALDFGSFPTGSALIAGACALLAIVLLVVLRHPPERLVPSPVWSMVWIAAWCLLPLIVVAAVGWRTRSVAPAAGAALIAYLQPLLDGYMLADDAWLRTTGLTLGVAALGAAACVAFHRRRPTVWSAYGLVLSMAVALGTMFSLIAPHASAVWRISNSA